MKSENNKLRVYVISNMYPSKTDAYFGVFVKNFCEGIEKDGSISIVCKSLIRGQGKSYYDKLCKYLIFYFSILFNGFFKKYDLIYVHNVSHSILPLYPVILKKMFADFKVVLNPHGEDMIITHKLDGLLLKLSLPFIRRADLIVSPSNYFKLKIIQLYNLDYKRIFVSASGGINLDLFKPLTPPARIETKTLGFVSRIEADKGWDTVLHAVAKLVMIPEFHNLQVLFVGKGQNVADLLNLAKQLNITQYICYLGFKSQLELPGIFNRLDAFLFPTKMFESLGLVGLEAMACGIPVIGSDRGGINDYLDNNENGYSFKCADASSLVDQIIKFYNLTDFELAKMKDSALETALRFSRQRIVDQMTTKLISLSHE